MGVINVETMSFEITTPAIVYKLQMHVLVLSIAISSAMHGVLSTEVCRPGRARGVSEQQFFNIDSKSARIHCQSVAIIA